MSRSELIFERSSFNDPTSLGSIDPERERQLESMVPEDRRRKVSAGLPSVSELDVVRHFTGLSQKNFCVDANFYPLGSCTMKYNPKAFDAIAAEAGFAAAHPYQHAEDAQGALQVLYETQSMLSSLTGMDEFTLEPAAGAHGELCGLFLVGAYHRSKKQVKTKVLVPDSSHGTNPASAALCGYEVVQVRTDERGHVDSEDLDAKLDDQVACLMMTNPNTLGIFEAQILQITHKVHQAGALLYYDGANMNALLGLCRPGDMGFDVMHLNLHKTFAVPHGSGGPGSGPVGVKRSLVPFLPGERIVKRGDRFELEKASETSIGKMRSFYGNFAAVVRAYAYLLALGREGLKAVALDAILNANYLKRKLKDLYEIPYPGHCMHEFVMSAVRQKKKGVKALDIGKRLLDYGIHAPTVYFPLIVEEAMMVEPTETESKAALDEFVNALTSIEREIDLQKETVLRAPLTTPVRRIDEVRAARQPDLSYKS